MIMNQLNIIVAMLLLFGYSIPDNINHNTGHIVVIFDSIQSNSDTIFFKTGGQLIIARPILTFCPDDSTEKIGSISKIVKDTLFIPTKSDHLLIHYRFAPINYFSFLANNGDTIKINHVQGVPFVVVANRTVAPFDCNYDFFRRKRYMLIDNTSILEHLSHPSYLRYMGIVNNKKYGKVAEGLPAKAIEEMLNERQWIDSLRNCKQISSVVFEYLKKKNNYTCATLELSSGRGKTDEELEKILTEYHDSTYRTDYYYPYRLYYKEVAERYCRSKTQSVDGLNYKSAYQYF